MTPEEIATFIEERATLEDARESEADYAGQRGKGKYLRALATELRDKFNVRSQTSTIPDIHASDEAAAEITYLQGELAEARSEIAHLKEVLEDEGIYTGTLSFTPEEHAKLKELVAAASPASIPVGHDSCEDNSKAASKTASPAIGSTLTSFLEEEGVREEVDRRTHGKVEADRMRRMADERHPGSDEAVAAGCICPRMDNCRGKGRYGNGEKYGWWMVEGCPLHDAPPRDYSSSRDKEPSK